MRVGTFARSIRELVNRPFLYCSKDGAGLRELLIENRTKGSALEARGKEGKKEVEKRKDSQSHLGRGLLLLPRVGGVASSRESKLGLLDELDTLGDRSGQLGEAGREELLLVRREVAERVELLDAVGLWRVQRASQFTGSRTGRKKEKRQEEGGDALRVRRGPRRRRGPFRSRRECPCSPQRRHNSERRRPSCPRTRRQ